MTSLTCPANQKLDEVHGALDKINIFFENITSNYDNQTEDVVIDLLLIKQELVNITEGLNKTRSAQEDFMSILKNLSPEIDIQHEKVEAFQVALVCLWIDLQSLMNNVTKMSSAQTSGQLTNTLRWSDLTTSISYLQQHFASTNQNMSTVLDRLAVMEADVTSLRETLNVLGRTRMAGSIQNETSGILTEKLSEMKAKLGKNQRKYDFQSTLANKHNVIPTFGNKRDFDYSREILEMMEMTDAHFVNVTMATVFMEHELSSLRLNFEERMREMEGQIQSLQGSTSHEAQRTREPIAPNITCKYQG